MDPAQTLTEANRKRVTIVGITRENGTYSNARRIPYVERYQGFTGPAETPAERLQQAAEDEEKRSEAS